MSDRSNPAQESIPLPSHVHYELLLQLLERQSILAVPPRSRGREQIQQLIITLRKALAQQKQLEEDLARSKIEVEYRWSLNREGGATTPLPHS
ncbi:MAG: DUF5340 domain-containing protein [Synechococcales bacterium]|nr:DUF5340 domain-containing protein [Synechococcales bacterium]